MKKIIFIIFPALLFAGCVSVQDLKEGQAFIHETQVEGLDISIPIPMMQTVNIVNFRFGFIQHKSYKGFNVPYHSTSEYKDISIVGGTGSIIRTIQVNNE